MSILPTRNNATSAPVNFVLLACTAFLAAEPVVWLSRTWFDASWGSWGEWVFVGVVALFGWSVTSRRIGRKSGAVPALLFAATAVIRIVGHVLAINVVGALALVVDVYALGLLFGVHRRERAVSPFWLAVLFALSLPMERILQRVVGFGLQQVSAAGACGLLSAGFDGVRCDGVDILLAGKHVLVDLPCSGARGLLLMGAAFVALAALTRPNVRWAVGGVLTTAAAALVSNTIRISTLAVGIAFPTEVGVDVMAQPWHDVVGLACLGLGLFPVVVWAQAVPPRAADPEGDGEPPKSRGVSARWVAGAMIAACIGVAFTPESPVDVARSIETLKVPDRLAGRPADRLELSERESDYFTQFGGAAAKAQYGARTLLLVRTSAPLRHLHAPDECLTGAGFEVRRLGISHGAMPGATYRAVGADGRAWRVVVTYRSDAGHTASSVSEVVWKWLQNPETTWTAIERVHPWRPDVASDERFDEALKRALED